MYGFMARISLPLALLAFLRLIASSNFSGEELISLSGSESLSPSKDFIELADETNSESSPSLELQLETFRFQLRSADIASYPEFKVMLVAAVTSLFHFGSMLLCVPRSSIGHCEFNYTSMALAGTNALCSLIVVLFAWHRALTTVSTRSDFFGLTIVILLISTFLYMVVPILSIIEGILDVPVGFSIGTSCLNFFSLFALGPYLFRKMRTYFKSPREDLHLALKMADHRKAVETLDKIALRPDEAATLLVDALGYKSPDILAFIIESIDFDAHGPSEVLQVLDMALLETETSLLQPVLHAVLERLHLLSTGEIEAIPLGRNIKKMLQIFNIYKGLILFINSDFGLIPDIHHYIPLLFWQSEI